MFSFPFFRKKAGIDIVEVDRFREFETDRGHVFLKKVFTPGELDHCFRNRDAAPHLAGLFAAKEAVSKALGTDRFPFAEIEIRHEKNGAPVAYKNSQKLPVVVSISHTHSIAAAIAVG